MGGGTEAMGKAATGVWDLDLDFDFVDEDTPLLAFFAFLIGGSEEASPATASVEGATFFDTPTLLALGVAEGTMGHNGGSASAGLLWVLLKGYSIPRTELPLSPSSNAEKVRTGG